MKVWFGGDEVAVFLVLVEDTTYWVAFGLGLRSAEIITATPADLADGPTGTMLRVPEGKDRKYRETSVLADLETTIRTVDDVRAESSGSPLVDVLARTVRRWVDRYADEAAKDDDGWRDLSMHDFRRTGATLLAGAEDVDPLLVCLGQVSGLGDVPRGAPEGQRRPRDGVEWL